MTRSPRPRQRALFLRSLLALLGLTAALVLPGCENPSCIFGSQGCQASAGGGGETSSAAFPEVGEWIAVGAPRVDAVYPQGSGTTETPIVIVFSESMTPASMQKAFEIQEVGGFVTAGTAIDGSLVGDGRMLVLFPPPLTAGSRYEVYFTDDGAPRDLTGSLAVRPKDGLIGAFDVVDATDPAPRIVATWPGDGNVGQSTISEIVAVFDRPLDPSSVDSSSWLVLVDGLAPPFDADPTALTVGAGGASVQETRVWSWRSVNTETEVPADLGAGKIVRLTLSPDGGKKITTLDGDELSASVIQFTTQLFSVPVAARIISEPDDAIGIENLGGVRPLLLEVEFTGELADGDALRITIFGTAPPTGVEEEAPVIIALEREVPLYEGVAIAVVNQEDLQLLLSSNPLTPRFQDGDLSFAFHIRRGGGVSPVQVLDVDPDTEGIQDPVLDTVPPTFFGLIGVTAENPTDYRSDVRDLVVLGEASENLRTVEVIAQLTGGPVDNRIDGELPPLPVMLETGDFIASPVALGQIDPAELPVDFSVIIYDAALNPAPAYEAQYTQVGASGPGTPLHGSGGAPVTVTVYDASTRLPLAGATVYSHMSVGGILSVDAPNPLVTSSAGSVTIDSAQDGETLITVEKPGYDLFTFQGVQTSRLDVLLAPVLLGPGAVQPVATAQGDEFTASFIKTWIADSRGVVPGDAVHQGTSTNYNPIVDQTVCNFDPVTIRARRLGLLTFLATKDPADPTDPNAFSAASYLQAFTADYPRPAVEPGGLDTVGVDVSGTLSGADVDPDDVPVGTPPAVFEKSPDYATAFPNPLGDPRVSVEVLVRGLPGSMTVGLGLPYFNIPSDHWDIRAAYSAEAKAEGQLVSDNAIEDERFLRLEHVDILGSRSGTRPRASTISGALVPPALPRLEAPDGSVEGQAYDLEYTDVFGGAQDEKGLYRALLTDASGRRWHLWRPDPLDGPDPVTAHLPPIELAGGTPLENGSVTCVIQGWSWPGIDLLEFMWTDVEREHDHFVNTAPVIYVQLAR